MLTRNEHEVLFVACEMERRGIMTYRRAQMVIQDPAVIALLQNLESDEMAHLKAFSALLEDAPEEDLGERRVFLSALAKETLLKGGVMGLAREDALASPKDLIAYAIKDEEAAIDTYLGFARDAKAEPVKNAFLLIADEEKRHLAALINVRNQIEEHG